MRSSREHRARGTLLEELPAVRFQPLPHGGLGGSGLRTGRFYRSFTTLRCRGQNNRGKSGQKASNSITLLYFSASRGGTGNLIRPAISEGEFQCQLNLARPGREIWPDQFGGGLSEPRAVSDHVVGLIELHAVEKIVELET
jgi:hypothetical protein